MFVRYFKFQGNWCHINGFKGKKGCPKVIKLTIICIFLLFDTPKLWKIISDVKEMYTTCGKNMTCSCIHQDISSFVPCTQEEANIRMLLPFSRFNEQKVMLRIVDADVPVLVISTVTSLVNTDIWVVFGYGKYFRCILAHEIAK